MPFMYEEENYIGTAKDTARGITLHETTTMLPGMDREFTLNWHDHDIKFLIESEYKSADSGDKVRYSVVYSIDMPADFPAPHDEVIAMITEALSVFNASGNPEYIKPERIAITPHVFREDGGATLTKNAKIKLWRDGAV